MSCPEFIAESFALGTATRLLHLTTTSYAQHVALGDFYAAQSDLIDKFAEVYMGLERKPASFPSIKPPSGLPNELLEDYLQEVREELEECSAESLKNILAEIEELTARTIYKLKYLK